jgi:hypothetical protein
LLALLALATLSLAGVSIGLLVLYAVLRTPSLMNLEQYGAGQAAQSQTPSLDPSIKLSLLQGEPLATLAYRLPGQR